MRLKILLAILLVFTLGGCGGCGEPTLRCDDATPVEHIPSGPAADLPLLDTGTHLGFNYYGSGERPPQAMVDTVIEGIEEGLTGFSFYVDWWEFESPDGTIDATNFAEQLQWQRELGLIPLVNLSLLNIADINLPADLLSDDGTLLKPGLNFDDHEILTRLFAILDEFVPLLVESGGFLLLLGNEVDEHFLEFPDSDIGGYARLLGRARAHIQSIEPDLAVGVTLTGKGMKSCAADVLRKTTDVLAFNYYPLVTEWGDDWLTVKDFDQIRPDLDELVAYHGEGPIVIQELGCPSGEATLSSPERQAECFEVLLETLRSYEDLRFVSVFSLQDFSPSDCEIIVEVFGIGPDDLTERTFATWKDYLCTLGVLTPEGEPKPAWEILVEEAGQWRPPG